MMDIGRTLYVLLGGPLAVVFERQSTDTTQVSLQAGERTMNHGQPEISL